MKNNNQMQSKLPGKKSKKGNSIMNKRAKISKNNLKTDFTYLNYAYSAGNGSEFVIK